MSDSVTVTSVKLPTTGAIGASKENNRVIIPVEYYLICSGVNIKILRFLRQIGHFFIRVMVNFVFLKELSHDIKVIVSSLTPVQI